MMPASLNVQIPGSDINSNRPCVSDRGYWIVVTLPPRSQDLVPICINRSSAWTQTGFDHFYHHNPRRCHSLYPLEGLRQQPERASRPIDQYSAIAVDAVLIRTGDCQRQDHQNQATNTQHDKLLASTRRKARKKALDPGSTQSNQPTAGPSGQPSYPSQPHESYHDDDQGMDLIEDSGHILPAEDNNQVTGYNSDFDASCENQPGSPTSPRHSVVIVEETEQAAEALGLDLLFDGEANENFLDDPLDTFWMHDGNPFEADHGPASPSDSLDSRPSAMSTGGTSDVSVQLQASK
ncbi:hypothetical protein JB92DRAFT_2832058 [Gautieria morchelliformis]|nr:hypothetical protein JB92DRAFT_2832058 [Gautieria morchelliformis]